MKSVTRGGLLNATSIILRRDNINSISPSLSYLSSPAGVDHALLHVFKQRRVDQLLSRREHRNPKPTSAVQLSVF